MKKVLTNRNGIHRLADEINVLKDYYLYDDAKTESEIQADIFRRLCLLDQKNSAQGKPTKHGQDARPHFMTILADEPVLLGDGAIDKTPPRPDGFELFHYTQIEKFAAPASVSGACRTDGRDTDKDQPAGSIGSDSGLKLQPRVHQRIVFKELCDTLYTLRDFNLYVECLASIVKGTPLFLCYSQIADSYHRPPLFTSGRICPQRHQPRELSFLRWAGDSLRSGVLQTIRVGVSARPTDCKYICLFL